MRLGFLGVILVAKVHKSHSSERVATVEVDEEEVVEYVATARYQFDQHASITENRFTNDTLKAAKPYLKDSRRKPN